MVLYGYHMNSGFIRCENGMAGYDTMHGISEDEYMKMEHCCNVLMAAKDCMAGKVSLSSFAHVVNCAELTKVPIAGVFFKLHKLEL